MTAPATIADTVANNSVIKVYYVKDESQKKELKYTVEYYKDNEKVIITDGETLYDTSESLSVEENGGKPTIEVFADNGEDIINNTTR